MSKIWSEFLKGKKKLTIESKTKKVLTCFHLKIVSSESPAPPKKNFSFGYFKPLQ